MVSVHLTTCNMAFGSITEHSHEAMFAL